MKKVVVVTGAGAGVGRASAEEFARHGFDVALLSRDAGRLERAAKELRNAYGVRALPISTDVADAGAVDAAATEVEETLGPISVWVNAAMATAFAPVSLLTPEEIERATKVTYLGQVHGMMAALSRMRVRNRGTIVNVGSALGYRSVPLQSAYCGAKFAIRGFTDSLRSEIIHDRLNVHLTMVDLPAVNTPSSTGRSTKWASVRGPSLLFSSLKSPRAPFTSPRLTVGARSGWASRQSRRSSPTVSRLRSLIAILRKAVTAVS